MPDGPFHVEVVTPEANLLSQPARALVLRSSDGDLTVLAGHTDLVSDVVPGEVRVEDADGAVVRVAVHGGYLQVERAVRVEAGEAAAAGERVTRATVLVGVAELADAIDVPRAQAAKEAAEATLAELRGRGGAAAAEEGAGGGDHELARAQAALARAEVRLAVAGAGSASASGSG